MSDVPPALAALYASERAAAGVPQADRERIRNAVLASVGVTVVAGGATTAAAATATATTASGIAGKLVVALVTVGAIGGGAALLSRDPPVDVGTPAAITEPHASPPRASSAPLAASPVAPTLLAETKQPVTPPPPSATSRSSDVPVSRARVSHSAPPPAPETPASSHSAPPPAPETPASSAEAEAETTSSESDVQRLSRAVSLSARGNDAGALALLETVAGTSDVAEERDALRIITFSKLGRIAEACAAVTAFVARYPHSIHRAAVEEVPCPSVR